ncbi:MAG: hypothetical protein LBM95_08820 [Lactobacillales bacterium]|jgi:hypothetical protein|nr:hypothetical protein [Lactobacillales bacterium]
MKMGKVLGGCLVALLLLIGCGKESTSKDTEESSVARSTKKTKETSTTQSSSTDTSSKAEETATSESSEAQDSQWELPEQAATMPEGLIGEWTGMNPQTGEEMTWLIAATQVTVDGEIFDVEDFKKSVGTNENSYLISWSIPAFEQRYGKGAAGAGPQPLAITYNPDTDTLYNGFMPSDDVVEMHRN